MTAETVWEGRFIAVRKDGTWEYVERAAGLGAAVVIAVTDADELVLIEEYRVPMGKPCIGFPAGLVGDDGADEIPAEAARRELEEESGFRAERLVRIGDFYSSPGLTSECLTLYRAEGLTRVGPGGGVDGENIIVHLVPRSEIDSFLEAARARGAGIDIKLIAALRLL